MAEKIEVKVVYPLKKIHYSNSLTFFFHPILLTVCL